MEDRIHRNSHSVHHRDTSLHYFRKRQRAAMEQDRAVRRGDVQSDVTFEECQQGEVESRAGTSHRAP